MKPLNKQSEKVFNSVLEKLNGSDHCRIGEKGKAIMPLSVEKLTTYDVGTVYSFCHYFEQNGDLCQDPEMLFLLHKTCRVYPMMFQMAIPPVYEESVFFDNGWKVKTRLQAKHTKFANTWLKNIKNQQGL